jgi:hypothetical protein
MTRWLVALFGLPALVVLTTVIWANTDAAGRLHVTLTALPLYFAMLIVWLAASVLFTRFALLRIVVLALCLSLIIGLTGGARWLTFLLAVAGSSAAGVAILRAPRTWQYSAAA